MSGLYCIYQRTGEMVRIRVILLTPMLAQVQGSSSIRCSVGRVQQVPRGGGLPLCTNPEIAKTPEPCKALIVILTLFLPYPDSYSYVYASSSLLALLLLFSFVLLLCLCLVLYVLLLLVLILLLLLLL